MAASCIVAAGQAVASRAPPAVVVSASGRHPGASASSERPSSFDAPQLFGKSLSSPSKPSANGGMSASRARKLFFLRAARPLLQKTAPLRRWQRNRAVSQKEAEEKNKDEMTATDVMDALVAGSNLTEGMDPLPLHAQGTSFIDVTDGGAESVSAQQLQQQRSSSPALNPVDWVLLKAQGVPMPSFDFDIKWNFPWPRDGDSDNGLPPPASLASLTERRDALKQELEVLELMLRPQCPWPRDPHAFIEEEWVLSQEEDEQDESDAEETTAFLVEESDEEINVVEVLPAGPHCAWPRHAGRVATPAAEPPTSAVTSAAVTAEAFARCAWPRTNNQSTPLSAVSAVSAASAISAVSAAPAPAPGPRCEWPRKSFNPLVPIAAPSTPAAPGASCSWPRVASSATAVTAVKPVSFVPSLDTSAAPPSARCAWPRGSAQVQEQRVLASPGPHCAWPRKSALSAVAPPAVAAPVPAPAEAPAVFGPRCSWPRATSATSAVAPPSAVSAAASAALPHLDLAVGPRCSWPRQTSTSAVSALAAAVAAVADSPAPAEATPLGPRCAWPRAVPTVTPVVREVSKPEPVKAQQQEQQQEEVARVQAPGAAARVASPAVDVSDGPRCMWPRGSVLSQALMGGAAGTGKGMMSVGLELPAPTPVAAAAAVPMGPRCEWPRKGSVAAAAAAAPVAAVVVDVEVVAAPAPTPMGPRCPWPRNASTPAPTPVAAPAKPAAEPVLRRQLSVVGSSFTISSSSSGGSASSLDQYMRQRKREPVVSGLPLQSPTDPTTRTAITSTTRTN
ncbi:unnamed protein product, partial [Closterium sp. NIES-64]